MATQPRSAASKGHGSKNLVFIVAPSGQFVTSPVPVAGDLVFQSIDVDRCTCGVASNVAYCWGPGSEGCIGDGARVNRGVPTKVAGQP